MRGEYCSHIIIMVVKKKLSEEKLRRHSFINFINAKHNKLSINVDFWQISGHATQIIGGYNF